MKHKPNQPPPQKPKKLRVAAYARVSKELLEESLVAQMSFYKKYIESNPEWEYAGVYSDDAISGAHMENRPGFLQMMADAKAGKIDYILVKSLSRWARNTLDLLNTVRKLKALGIGVYFETQNIDTLSTTGEFMLTICASLAQDELRSMSENVRWRFAQKMERGEPMSGKVPFGLRCKNGEITVVPEEAEIVRYMARRYLDGASTGTIAAEVNAMGSRTIRGYPWRAYGVWLLLENEKICGRNLLQKVYTAGPMDKQHKNKGELPQVLVENNHEAIIPPEMYEEILSRMQRLRRMGIQDNQNPSRCTKKLLCSCCGANMSHTRRSEDGTWRCRRVNNCPPTIIHDWELDEICSEAVGELDDDTFFETVVRMVIDGQDRQNCTVSFLLSSGEVRIVHYELHTRSAPHYSRYTGKIVCGCCGKSLHKSNPGWRCVNTPECRILLLHEWELDEVVARAIGNRDFAEAVDHITAETIDRFHCNLHFHMTDGKKRVFNCTLEVKDYPHKVKQRHLRPGERVIPEQKYIEIGG